MARLVSVMVVVEVLAHLVFADHLADRDADLAGAGQRCRRRPGR